MQASAVIESASESKLKNAELAAPPHRARRRRRFSAEQKARILREADACSERGQLSELLRREGIYSSHLSLWRAQRTQLGLLGLQTKRPGPKPRKDAQDKLIEQLHKRVEKLARELRLTKALLELQEEAHPMLGIGRSQTGDDPGEDAERPADGTSGRAH